MMLKGINYDTGTITITGRLTRETFNPDIVAREMEVIRQDLHCNAVRISGVRIERISEASRIALQKGLVVWFSPSLPYDNQENTLEHLIKAAVAAEKLRREFSNLVLVTGSELSIFTSGFVKGPTWEERFKNLFSPFSILKNMIGLRRTYNKRLNRFLSKAVKEIRKHFHGEISYASGSWEKVNWTLFDIAGVDHYRSSYNEPVYRRQLQDYKNKGRPLAITEFGCCAYKGAEKKGPSGWMIVDWNKQVPEIKDAYTRDEEVQAKYLLDLLEIFEAENIFACFVFTFISYNYLYNDDPIHDLDMASYGIVKAMHSPGQGYHGQLPWLPKKAFYALSDYYQHH